MHQKMSDSINDFMESQYRLFIDPVLINHAETILHHFARQLPQPANTETIIATLFSMGKLNLALEVKLCIPALLIDFFNYLDVSGLVPGSARFATDIERNLSRYQEAFRDDGSMRGETFVKKYSDTNRNDPCPCGSGLKFKKCCLPLIS